MALKTKIYIFDIDNTLCDTWPTLKRTKKGRVLHFITECWRISRISPFQGMMLCVKSRLRKKNCEVFFLSARHWSLWWPTYLYLARNVGPFNPRRLTLVPDANSKIRCFDNFLQSTDGPITVVDDLSYNTEHGQTLYYKEVIHYLRVSKRPIRYVDKSKIDLINNSFLKERKPL
jgi:hypothetical protein